MEGIVVTLAILGGGITGTGLIHLLVGIFSDRDLIPLGALFLMTGLALLTVSYFLYI